MLEEPFPDVCFFQHWDVGDDPYFGRRVLRRQFPVYGTVGIPFPHPLIDLLFDEGGGDLGYLHSAEKLGEVPVEIPALCADFL